VLKESKPGERSRPDEDKWETGGSAGKSSRTYPLAQAAGRNGKAVKDLCIVTNDKTNILNCFRRGSFSGEEWGGACSYQMEGHVKYRWRAAEMQGGGEQKA